MEKFTTHTGVAMPLTRSAVDTDQIIPAVYLKRVTKTGFLRRGVRPRRRPRLRHRLEP
jgi:3-isopropylmalate dehydratase small subunit